MPRDLHATHTTNLVSIGTLLAATGIQVSCQREREREKNRFIALRTVVEKIEMGSAGGGKGKVLDKAGEKAKKNKVRCHPIRNSRQH